MVEGVWLFASAVVGFVAGVFCMALMRMASLADDDE